MKSAARIIPAYAGSTDAAAVAIEAPPDHPRIRGEHSPCLRARTIATGSSPHTRGARYREIGFETIDRIIPAYAGSTLLRASRTSGMKDHPRIRGEHGIDILGRRVAKGSSPHTRGAREKRHIFYRHDGIIPAYAGSTPSRIPAHCR